MVMIPAGVRARYEVRGTVTIRETLRSGRQRRRRRESARCTGNERETEMATIGFIGASGLMGHGMAKNLLAKGHELALTVHRNRERLADLAAAGAVEQPSAAALAKASEIVFLCVTGSPQVEAAIVGPDGLLD